MKPKYIFWPILFVLIGAAMAAMVMLLWNWLMPAIFGLGLISFWQALGILVLSKILFGGFSGKRGGCGHRYGGHYGHSAWKEKFKSRWAGMSEEDRKKWEEKCGSKWGSCTSAKE